MSCPNCHTIGNQWRTGATPETPWYADVCFTCGWCRRHKNYNPSGAGDSIDVGTQNRYFLNLGVCSLTDENGNKIIASNYGGIKEGRHNELYEKYYNYWESGYFNYVEERVGNYFDLNEIVKTNFLSGRFDSLMYRDHQYRTGSIALTGLSFLCWNRLYTLNSGGNRIRTITTSDYASQRFIPDITEQPHHSPVHLPYEATGAQLKSPIVFHGDVKTRFENYKKYHCVVNPNTNMTYAPQSADRPAPQLSYNNNNYNLESKVFQASIYSYTENLTGEIEPVEPTERKVLAKNLTNGELTQIGSGVNNNSFELSNLSGTFPRLEVDCYWSNGQWNGTVNIDYNPTEQTAINKTKIYDFYSLSEVNEKFPFIENNGELMTYSFNGLLQRVVLDPEELSFYGFPYLASGITGAPWPFSSSGWTGVMDKVGYSGQYSPPSVFGLSSAGATGHSINYVPSGGNDWLGQGDIADNWTFNQQGHSSGSTLYSKLFYTNGQTLSINYSHYTGTGTTDSYILNDQYNFVQSGKDITPKWIFYNFLDHAYHPYDRFVSYATRSLENELYGFMWTNDSNPVGATWNGVDWYGQEFASPFQPNFSTINTDNLPARMNFTGYIFTNSGAYDALNKFVKSRSGSNYELADATDVLGSDATINIQALIDPYTFLAETGVSDDLGRPRPSFISSNLDELFTLDPRSHQTYSGGNWYYTGDGKDQVSGKIICLNTSRITDYGRLVPETNVVTPQIITGNTAHYDTKFLHDNWLIMKEPCFDHWLSGYTGVTYISSGSQYLSSLFNRGVMQSIFESPDNQTQTQRWTVFELKKPISQIITPTECSKVKDFYSGLDLEFTGNHIDKLRPLISSVYSSAGRAITENLDYYYDPSGFYYEVQNGVAGGTISKLDYETGKCCSGETVSTDEDCVVFTGKLLTGSSSTHPSYILRKYIAPPSGDGGLCVGSPYNVTISSGSGDSQFYGEGSPYTWTLSRTFSTYYLYGYSSYPVLISLGYYSYSLTGTYTNFYGSSPSITVTSGSC